jgi:hypothetical protein
VSAALEWQAEIGFPVVTDGELSRRGFQESFGAAVTGFDAAPERYEGASQYPPEPSDDSERSAPAPRRIESGLDGDGPAISRRRPTRERLRLVRNVICAIDMLPSTAVPTGRSGDHRARPSR